MCKRLESGAGGRPAQFEQAVTRWVTLPRELDAALSDEHERTGAPRSEILRRALRGYLGQQAGPEARA